MELRLYKAATAAAFGRNCQKPLRAAAWRLGGCLVFCCLLGTLVANGAGNLPLTAWHSATVGLALLTALQSCVLFVLITASGMLHNNGTFENILLFLPLPASTRWRIYCLPGVVLGIFALTLIAPCLCLLASKSGLGPIPIILYCSLGFVVALVSLYGSLPLRGARLPAISLILAAEYGLTRLSAVAPLAAALGYTTLLVGIVVMAYVIMTRSQDKIFYAKQYAQPVRTHTLPTGFWFIKKALRNRSSRLTLVTNSALSVGLCIGLGRMPGGLLIAPACISLLVASCVSDIRALSRTNNPAEIATLRGTAYFVLIEVAAAGLLALALATPLFLSLHPTAAELVRLAASLAAGLFAGSLIAPAHKDISAQVLATLLCVSVLIVPVQLLDATALSSRWELFLLMALTSVLLIASYTAEYKRNPYAWRHHAAKRLRTTN